MGNCGSTSNKRDTQQKTQPVNTVQNSRAQPKKEPLSQPQYKDEPKTLPLKIVVKEKGETILNGEFDREKKIEEIYSDLNLDPTRDYEVIYDGKPISLKLSSKIKDLFDTKVNTVELSVNYVGLDIADNCRVRYEETTNYIGTLLLDNPELFGLVIYDKNTQKATEFNYSFSSDHILKNFGAFSAFCNANNKIYLSGGEVQTSSSTAENLRHFVEINLETADRENIEVKQLPDLNEARTWHSMLYVPDSKIFIVGGTDSQTVEIYDILTQTIEVDSKMNEKRCECTLCLVNNSYLYVFCGFILHQSYLNSIERCNLRKKSRVWEMVDVEYENNITFNPSFFAVAYNKDNILLLGGNENADDKEKNYLVQIPQNNNSKIVISDYHSFDNVAGVYREKFFMPVNSSESVLIPLVSGDIKLLVMDEKTGQIEKKEYSTVEESDRY